MFQEEREEARWRRALAGIGSAGCLYFTSR